MMFGTGMGWGFGLGWIVMVLFWVFVIAGIVWLVLTVSRTATTGTGGPGKSTALRILEERFARGEIDAEEFRAKKRALEEV